MQSPNSRIKGTVEPPPSDLGSEVHPRDLVVGEVYYYIPHPDSPTSAPYPYGATLPHKYYKGIYTGTRPTMQTTAYMKKLDASGKFDDYKLVSMIRYGSIGPGIFYKSDMTGMSPKERETALLSLARHLPGGTNLSRRIVNAANYGTRAPKPKSSSSASGGRRRRRHRKTKRRN
jgi:hypothetical protein